MISPAPRNLVGSNMLGNCSFVCSQRAAASFHLRTREPANPNTGALP
jgi:hypothetical protein